MSPISGPGSTVKGLEICSELGIRVDSGDPGPNPDQLGRQWASSGLSAITGRGSGREAVPAGVVRLADLLDGHWFALTGRRIETLGLASARAAVMARTSSPVAHGCQFSWGGSTAVMSAVDGTEVALALARAQDWASLGALFSTDRPIDRWEQVARLVGRTDPWQLMERAELLGMAAAVAGHTPADSGARAVQRATGPNRALDGLLVVDLSALWAGPLCARLLSDAGATVVKVEDPARPDGARLGDADWYQTLHGGHLAVAVDFGSAAGRRRLESLLAGADVVIEGSRPRALLQLGIDPEQMAARGTIWLSITGHGRADGASRVGFGDDAALAGGLLARWRGASVWLGDAVADPLTGVLAAVCAAHAARRGGGWLVELALAGTAMLAADDRWGPPISAVGVIEPARPMPRPVRAAPAIGADDDLVSVLFGRRE